MGWNRTGGGRHRRSVLCPAILASMQARPARQRSFRAVRLGPVRFVVESASSAQCYPARAPRAGPGQYLDAPPPRHRATLAARLIELERLMHFEITPYPYGAMV